MEIDGLSERSTTTSLEIVEFTRLTQGDEEARLRTKVFVSFVKPIDLGGSARVVKKKKKEKKDKN